MGKSPPRRSAREGTVYPRKDRPGYRGEITWMIDGRKRRKVVSGATQQEARDRLDDERRKLRLGTLDAVGAGTVGEYLTGWLERQRVASDCRPGEHRSNTSAAT